MGRHRRRLQELHGGPAEAAVPPDTGQGGARPGDEQARWASLDLPRNAPTGQGVPVKGSGLADGIEVFPKHDAIGSGEFGNAIRGPLGIHRGANRRFWFYGADYTLEDQIAYINRLRKVTEEELRRFIAGKEGPQPDSSPRPERVTSALRTTG